MSREALSKILELLPELSDHDLYLQCVMHIAIAAVNYTDSINDDDDNAYWEGVCMSLLLHAMRMYKG